MKASALVTALQNSRRGYKFTVLLLAAWSPLVLPNYPAIAGLVMGLGTAVFLVATSQRSLSKNTPTKKIPEGPDA